MPSYKPIRTAALLPNEGDGQELMTLDLKKDWREAKAIHIAKDVAAFANFLGGTILVGAKELNGRVGTYHPMTEDVANQAKASFSQAVRDLCSPKPVFEPLVLPKADGFVLVVNVEPEVGSLVGVRVAGDKPRNGIGEDSYFFPIRSGVDSVFIPPEKVPMFVDARYRRLLILLKAIPPQTYVGSRVPVVGHSWSKRRFIAVLPELNVIQFDDGDLTPMKHMPIDLVQTVYRTEGGEWRLILTSEAHYSLWD